MYYKVVRPTYKKDHFLSAVSHPLEITYIPGKWIFAPKNTGILVFTTLEAADNFACITDCIFKCRAEIPLPLPSKCLSMDNLKEDLIKKLWTGKKVDYKVTSVWPFDTAAFKKVMLTERIY